jgi:hypothetical protein
VVNRKEPRPVGSSPTKSMYITARRGGDPIALFSPTTAATGSDLDAELNECLASISERAAARAADVNTRLAELEAEKRVLSQVQSKVAATDVSV